MRKHHEQFYKDKFIVEDHRAKYWHAAYTLAK